MKAWRMYHIGDMRLDEVPRPEPGPGWVVLKVKVAQLSSTEVQQSKGIKLGDVPQGVRGAQGIRGGEFENTEALLKAKGPLQLHGHEFSGEVVELGEGVDTLRKGDRVFYYRSLPCHECALCRAGYEEHCRKGIWVGKDIPGCLAEYIAIRAIDAVVIPESITDSEAAAMQPVGSAVGDVYDARVEMGDTVVVFGQGPIGLNILQVSRVCGASKVIAIARRDEVLTVSSKLGADRIINSTKIDPVEAVLEITEGRGADIVFECAGGGPEPGLPGTKTLNQAIALVRDGGKIIQSGHLTPDVVVPALQLTLRGIHYSGHKFLLPKLRSYVVDLVASKRLQIAPYITHMLQGLEKVPEASEITLNRAKYGAINPAQVVVSK